MWQIYLPPTQKMITTQKNKTAESEYSLTQVVLAKELIFRSHYPIARVMLPTEDINLFDQACNVNRVNYCILRSFIGMEGGTRMMLIGYQREVQDKIRSALILTKKYSTAFTFESEQS